MISDLKEQRDWLNGPGHQKQNERVKDDPEGYIIAKEDNKGKN